MAKSVKELDMEQVAVKFVNLPKGVTNKSAVINGGYMTEIEFEAVKELPRSVEMVSATKWSKVKAGDKERTLYPFYGLLTETEKAVYREYKKNHGSSVASSSASSKAEENNKALDALKTELTALGVPAETIAKLEQFRIAKRNDLVADLFGVGTIQALPGKVNLAYVMYRGKDGEFADSLQPDLVELIQLGFMPKYTLGQVKASLKKLADKGIVADTCIVDLK